MLHSMRSAKTRERTSLLQCRTLDTLPQSHKIIFSKQEKNMISIRDIPKYLANKGTIQIEKKETKTDF